MGLHLLEKLNKSSNSCISYRMAYRTENRKNYRTFFQCLNTQIISHQNEVLRSGVLHQKKRYNFLLVWLEVCYLFGNCLFIVTSKTAFPQISYCERKTSITFVRFHTTYMNLKPFSVYIFKPSKCSTFKTFNI